MEEDRNKDAGLPTGYEPTRAANTVKEACRDDKEFSSLVEPERMRRFLQEVVVQRFRKTRDAWAVSLARNLFGLVFDDGKNRFADLPLTEKLDIRSEVALNLAWLATQVKDKQLFGLALNKIREVRVEGKERRAPKVYKGHIECIGRDAFGNSIEKAAFFEYGPEEVYDLLNGPFEGLEPSPNVVRAITLRYVKSKIDMADSIDSIVPGSKKTFFNWLSELRDGALSDVLSVDDGFFVGSIVLLESLDEFFCAARRKSDKSEAHRYFDRMCNAYAELMVQSRKGTPKLHMTSNAKSVLDKADEIIMKARNSIKNI